MTNNPPLVLASASERRENLLKKAGFCFRAIPADADETLPSDLPHGDGAIEIARRKAEAIAPMVKGAVVLGADTIVVTPQGAVLGKPADEDDARRMLRGLSGTTHRVITGVCLIDTSSGKHLEQAVTTEVVFGEMSQQEIEAYVASGEAMGKAGAYAIQETGDRFVREVRGSFTNVVGLPMEAVTQMLAELAILPGAGPAT